jgi:hypothetical protein
MTSEALPDFSYKPDGDGYILRPLTQAALVWLEKFTGQQCAETIHEVRAREAGIRVPPELVMASLMLPVQAGLVVEYHWRNGTIKILGPRQRAAHAGEG